MAFQIGRWSYCTYTADEPPEWHVDGDPRREHDGGTTSPTLTLPSAAGPCQSGDWNTAGLRGALL
jgi:hypothetical protein